MQISRQAPQDKASASVNAVIFLMDGIMLLKSKLLWVDTDNMTYFCVQCDSW